MRGRLIVFEGTEGGGKTTQLERSLTWLQQHPAIHWLQTHHQMGKVVATREPGGTEVGRRIRQLLLHPETEEPIEPRTELLLYAADRAQHVDGWLEPHLQQGDLVLCDRYTASTITYQGYGRNLDLSLIHQLNQIAAHGLVSDLTLWLDVKVERGLARAQQRGNADRMEQATIDFHRRVYDGFQALMADPNMAMVRIDANQDADHVTQQIQTVLEQQLQQWYPMLSSQIR
jgi:dTMP kinase